MSDSQSQQKLIELQLLRKALFNTLSTRETIQDPGAKKASLINFCKGRTQQNVFGCQVSVLPAVLPENKKVATYPVSI